MTGALRIATNSAAVLSLGAAARAVGFLAFLLLSRALAPAELGTFALVLTTVEVVRQLTELGLGIATVRLLAADASRTTRPVAAALLLRTGLAALGLLLILAIASHPALVERRTLFLVGGLTLFAGAVHNSLTSAFQARLEMRHLVPAHLVSVATYLGAVSWGAAHGWGISAFLRAYVVQEVLLAAATTLTFRARFRLEFRGLTGVIRRLARDAAALGTLGAVVLLYYRIDVFMLEAMRGSEAVGHYALAFRITEAFLLLATALSTSSFPRLVEFAAAERDAELRSMFGVLYSGVVLSGGAVAFAVSLAAPVLMPRAFPGYAEAGALAGLLIWSVVFMFANSQTADLLISRGRLGLVTGIAFGNLVLNAVANALLIPRFGAAGAAAATVVTEGANAVAQAWFIRRRLGLPVPVAPWAAVAGLGGIAVSLRLGAPAVAGGLAICGAAVAAWYGSATRGRRGDAPSSQTNEAPGGAVRSGLVGS
ncbi:MAG TPA: oligosaccharide flippase family protein [Longimicrobiales bacterium]